MSQTILEVLSGSHCYGTDTPESDRDVRGILLPSWEEAVSLNEPTDMNRQGDGEDTVYFPLRKFVALAVKSNPFVLSWLYVPANCVLLDSPQAQMLRDRRHVFLCQEVYARCKGMAHGQMESIERKGQHVGEKRADIIALHGYNTKAAVAALLALDWAIEILTEQTLTLPSPNAGFYRAVKQGLAKLPEIRTLVSARLGLLETAKERTCLPEKPQFDAANALLLDVMRTQPVGVEP